MNGKKIGKYRLKVQYANNQDPYGTDSPDDSDEAEQMRYEYSLFYDSD